MRELYKEYFHVPKEGKVREKVLFSRITVAVIIMLIWMSAIGFTAYAYFTCSVTSGMNTITSATYSLKVEEPSGKAVADAENKNKYTLSEGVYDFKLTKEGTATTGYCKILIGTTNEPIITEQIGAVAAGEAYVESRTVRIVVTKETVVEFVACWGTYAGEPLKDASEMIIVEDQKAEIGGKQEPLTVSQTETTKQSDNIQGAAFDEFNDTTADTSTGMTDGGTPNVTNTQTGTTTDAQNNTATDTQSGKTSTTSEGSDDTTPEVTNPADDKSPTESETSEPTS